MKRTSLSSTVSFQTPLSNKTIAFVLKTTEIFKKKFLNFHYLVGLLVLP